MAEFIHTDRVRDTVVDVDAERLASVYASAGLDAAGGIGEQGQVVNELEAIVGEVLSLDSRLQQILASVLIAAEEKVLMLDRLFGGKVSTTTLNLLKVMARHKRLNLLRDVAKVSRKLWQARSGRIPVELETANPLDAALEKEILVAFGDVLGADAAQHDRARGRRHPTQSAAVFRQRHGVKNQRRIFRFAFRTTTDHQINSTDKIRHEVQ